MSRLVDPHLDCLRQQLLRMASFSEAILEKSLRALWTRDEALAKEVKTDDLEIDRLDVEIDETVVRLLATQAPVADDLREVIVAKMVAVDLERVGDLARNIAKSAIRLSERAEISAPSQLQVLADESQQILRRALDALAERDPSRAADVLADDDEVDEQQDIVIRAALDDIRSRPDLTSQEVDIILIAKNLERIADHATNIAESVIYAVEARIVKHADKLGR